MYEIAVAGAMDNFQLFRSGVVVDETMKGSSQDGAGGAHDVDDYVRNSRLDVANNLLVA